MRRQTARLIVSILATLEAAAPLAARRAQLMRKCAAGERWRELHLAGRAEKSINNSWGGGETFLFLPDSEAGRTLEK